MQELQAHGRFDERSLPFGLGPSSTIHWSWRLVFRMHDDGHDDLSYS